ncbi:MAG: Ig-like domain-containing protein [Candidatus Bathyarchaeota archaeon]|nr:Ig-like domain-containing protein [Candidatus Bathyarchaeota archaeon]MDW8040045.1 Ig-like domain-containing protein [Nitrososphaerota archaeon]
MLRKYLVAFMIAAVLTASIHTSQCYSPGCYTVAYYLLKSFNRSEQYKLNVAVTQSLYEYYCGLDHRQVSIRDFAKFVTPHPLKPIADKLWDIYSTHEDFANGVLMIVHQIPYNVTLPAKYPVETIVENVGDCDLFSYVAASIMKAGGLDVVLLYYPGKAHMNIAVHLPTAPRYARIPVRYVTYNGVRYYVAECTGGNWMEGWRVGECPEDLWQAECQIVSLEDCEKWAPGQVSASYKTLQPSAISLTLSSILVIHGSALTISGQLSPKLQNKAVAIYFRMGGSPWKALTIVKTDSEGKFSWTWIANETGVCQFKASWSGDDDYAGASSPTITVSVMSKFFLTIFITTVALVCMGLVIFLMATLGHRSVEEPELPRITY